MAERAFCCPLLSLIVPTRGRVAQLQRFLDSIQSTASHPRQLEVVLVIDEDDAPTLKFRHDGLSLKRVLLPPGQTMGCLNRAGYEASSGRYVMLLNDDVVARTPGWDEKVLSCCRDFPDDIVLIHTNDLLFKQGLCTFPLVSRTFCELASGICPREYVRYRIDDHIEDTFNLLGVLGERRIVYLPDVIFEHFNFTQEQDGQRIYASDPKALAHDAPFFETTFSQRKELALKLKEHIDCQARQAELALLESKLDRIDNSFKLRLSRLQLDAEEHLPISPQRRRRVLKEPVAGAPGWSERAVTVGLLTTDLEDPICKECIKRIKEHSPGHELLVVEYQSKKESSLPQELNRLLRAARRDRVVLLHDRVLVGPGWLDGLLRSLTPGVGVVTPVQRGLDEEQAYFGAVFHPAGSGHHGHLLGMPERPQPVLSFCNPVLLIDRMRCRHLLFDETQQQYCADLDFGLRVWESGLRVVCTPAAVVTNLAGISLPYGGAFAEDVFEADRRLFVAHWMLSGRFQKLEVQVWRNVPELIPLLELVEMVKGLLTAAAQLREEFRKPDLRFLEDLRRTPILEHALAAIGYQTEPATGAHSRQPLGKRLLHRCANGWTRAGRCLRREGILGLARATTRRLLSLLPTRGSSSQTTATAAPNPTRDARH
jgi:GT2 family glycosyltransferase